MRRREFNRLAAGSAATVAWGLTACGGGSSSSAPTSAGAGGGSAEGGSQPGAAPDTPRAPGPSPAPDPPAGLRALGTNLSGMEWAYGALRVGPRIEPNVDYTVPRAAEIAWLAHQGFGRNRLPIQWELLQPMLSDTPASAQARALIGEPGALDLVYAGFIDGVLDAHAAVGARCILDLHNFCRYKDFRFQADGSVIGLARSADARRPAYTTDPAQAWERIFATAPGASLSVAAYVDLWRRMVARWKDHPGLGGWGLMNEPHDLPRPGELVESTQGEDLLIWPAYARAAIDAIRALDPQGPIYLAGNAWGGAMTLTPAWNPAWPLAGQGIVYEVHAYVDAYNNGGGFDWDLEVAKGQTAIFGPGAMDADTGARRLRVATDWAGAKGQALALTETGMPIDDARWYDAFRRMAAQAWARGVEIQTWSGGSHWPARNYAINHVPGWHQHRTLEPLVSGELKAIAGIEGATLFDDGPGWSADGTVQVTVYARGHLASPVTLTVSSDGGGSFSKTTLVVPAGPNGQDTFGFTPQSGRVTTLSYAGAARQLPPPRQVFALADPVAHAAVDLVEAGRALLARYGACLWNLADAHTDFLQGQLAGAGDPVRAVADTGFGSSLGNAMEMLNLMNQDGPEAGPFQPPRLRSDGARRWADFGAPGTTALWCKKTIPGPTFPHPRNVLPYGLAEPHFVIAVVRAPGPGASGTVFLGSVASGGWSLQLGFEAGLPQARWQDTQQVTATLRAAHAPAAGERLVIAMTQGPAGQALRVGGAPVAASAQALLPAPLESLFLGGGFMARQHLPPFGGGIEAVATGRGQPSDAELGVMERCLDRMAGTP